LVAVHLPLLSSTVKDISQKMKTAYDKYYLQENYFGDPYPELIDFFENYPARGNLLDVGCGQGRDAIPLARLGYSVTGIDNSKIGIQQLNDVAQNEKLDLKGSVTDIYTFDQFQHFDFILLDSMFHFLKKDLQKEVAFIKDMCQQSKAGAVILFCIQNMGKKIEVLNQTLDADGKMERIYEIEFHYKFIDSSTGSASGTPYKMIAVKSD
jgi:2-polyprenyl-3-methyl-5-hydroxy-6-metoxy-1,4-benzoquinol methylase